MNPLHWNYSSSIPLKFPINDLFMSLKQTRGQDRLLNKLERHISTPHYGINWVLFFCQYYTWQMMVIQSYKFANSTIYRNSFFLWGCLALCNAIYSNTWISTLNSLAYKRLPILGKQAHTPNIHIKWPSKKPKTIVNSIQK